MARLDAVLSSDRRKLEAGYVEIPFCALALVEEAVERLRRAGATGEIEVVTLEPERAWLGGAAGRVTGTHPVGGELLAPGAQVIVYVNPGQPSDLSDRDLGVVELLRQDRHRRVAEREQIFYDSPTPRPNLAQRLPATSTLGSDLLSRLDARLRDGGALMAEAFAPGLTDEQIDELLLPAGITLPEEARVWCRWHNGIRKDASPNAHSFAWRELLSLEYAVEWYEMFRGMNFEAWGVDGLLCPLGEKPRIYFDCSGPTDEPVPIYAQNDETEAPGMVLGSIGDLVLAMLEYFELGIWTIDTDGAIRGNPDRFALRNGFL